MLLSLIIFVPKNKIVKVRQSVVNGRFNETKNESSNRDVKLNDRAFQAFKRQLERAKKQGSKTLFFNKHGNLLRLNLVVPGLNLIDPGSLTITGKEKCRQKQGLQLAA